MIITDLDRTVIYSHRVTSEYPISKEVESVTVEVKDGMEIGFTSKKMVNWLKNDTRAVIVANTARSLMEVERINISQYFDYIIAANGGGILHKGKVLSDWEDYLKREEIQDDLINVHTDIAQLKSSSYKPKIIDRSYVFSKVDNFSLADEELDNLRKKYTDFRFVRERNKVYAIPNRVSKLQAMKWLENYLSKEFIIAAGDSNNDIEMLNYARVRIVPAHAEIAMNSDIEKRIMPYIKVRSGVDGSEDIVGIVENILK